MKKILVTCPKEENFKSNLTDMLNYRDTILKWIGYIPTSIEIECFLEDDIACQLLEESSRDFKIVSSTCEPDFDYCNAKGLVSTSDKLYYEEAYHIHCDEALTKYKPKPRMAFRTQEEYDNAKIDSIIKRQRHSQKIYSASYSMILMFYIPNAQAITLSNVPHDGDGRLLITNNLQTSDVWSFYGGAKLDSATTQQVLNLGV